MKLVVYLHFPNTGLSVTTVMGWTSSRHSMSTFVGHFASFRLGQLVYNFLLLFRYYHGADGSTDVHLVQILWR